MKKYFLPFVFLFFFTCSLMAQRCGTGTAAIVSGTDTGTVFLPTASHLPCIDSGSYVADTIYLYNGNYFQFLMQRVILDSINNLPAGLCWQTNIAGDSVDYGGHMAILISGTCTDTVGRYQLNIKVTGVLAGNVRDSNLDASSIWGLYFLQVKHHADTCPTLDTNYIQPSMPAYITPGNDTIICPNATITLTANSGAGYIYRWSTGDTTQAITAGPGYYSVTVSKYPYAGVAAINVYADNIVPQFTLVQDSANPHHWQALNTSREWTYGGIPPAPLEYIWTWGDGNTTTGDTIAYTYHSTGQYVVCLGVYDTVYGCSKGICDTAINFTYGDIIDALQVGIGPYGIQQVNALPAIRLYPNPAAMQLTIASPVPLPLGAVICDALGRQLLQVNIHGTATIDIGQLPDGIYFMSFPDYGAHALRFAVAR